MVVPWHKGIRLQMSRLLRQFLEDKTGKAIEDVKPNDLQFFDQHTNQLAMMM